MSKLKVAEFQNKEQLNFFLSDVPRISEEHLQIIPLREGESIFYVVIYKD